MSGVRGRQQAVREKMRKKGEIFSKVAWDGGDPGSEELDQLAQCVADFAVRGADLFGQAFDFLSNHGKPFARFGRAGRLDRGIERDQADHLGNIGDAPDRGSDRGPDRSAARSQHTW